MLTNVKWVYVSVSVKNETIPRKIASLPTGKLIGLYCQSQWLTVSIIIIHDFRSWWFKFTLSHEMESVKFINII